MITAENLRKTYGSKTAVDGISFTAQPGRVTGFLGPNGAGKSTTMRMAVGLDRPSAGTITVNGRPFTQHRAPLREVGAVLDAGATHPGRTARQHLKVLAATHGIGAKRVEEVIELTGLGAVAKKRIKGFSLGMNQRLGIAAALLGDPATLIFDEPVNGLDPEGVRWVRQMCRQLAAEGRTVFLSSHLMSEMAPDRRPPGGAGARADHRRRPHPGAYRRRRAGTGPGAQRAGRRADERPVRAGGHPHQSRRRDLRGLRDGPRAVGQRALEVGAVLHELTPLRSSLEDTYMQLTNDEVEYRSGGLS